MRACASGGGTTSLDQQAAFQATGRWRFLGHRINTQGLSLWRRHSTGSLRPLALRAARLAAKAPGATISRKLSTTPNTLP